MNIIIRKATINDIEAIADIKIEGWQTFKIYVNRS